MCCAPRRSFCRPLSAPSQAPGAKKSIGQGPRAGTRGIPLTGCRNTLQGRYSGVQWHQSIPHFPSLFEGGMVGHTQVLCARAGACRRPSPRPKHKSNHFVTLRGEGATARWAPYLVNHIKLALNLFLAAGRSRPGRRPNPRKAVPAPNPPAPKGARGFFDPGDCCKGIRGM